MLGLLGLAAAPLAGCGVNNIPAFEEQAKAAWSDVLNQYKRRTDLTENLVNTVKGFAAQEQKMLKEVVEARARATQIQLPPDVLSNPAAMKQFIDAQATLGSALSRLVAVSEAYPELKSSQSFLQLQSQLEGSENRIANARRDYIQAVQVYNTELKTIPGRWWHSLLYPEAKEMAGFTISEEEMQPTKVEFN
jgi:LemA protein